MMDHCKYCGDDLFFFDRAPILAYRDDGAPFEFGDEGGWATDHCGDTVHDFICPKRDSSGRYPDGKPHEVAD